MREKYWHELFEVGLVLKGFNGVWEIISGFIILFVSKATITGWFNFLAHRELIEDPSDKLINFLFHGLSNISSGTQIFVAIYILLHGFLNIFLVVQLYRDKHWAYLVTIGTMLIFMIYQVHRIYLHHSYFLTMLTVFDIIFIVLAWHEYKYHTDLKKAQNMVI